jgi:Tfp pilus assembly protein PilO
MADIDNNNKFTDEDDSNSIKFDEVKHFLKFYALPLFSMIIFFGVLVFPVFNNIKYVFDTLDEIDTLKEQDQMLQQRLVKLEELRQQNIAQQEVISKINNLVPTGKSEVVKFRERVNSVAQGQSLNLQKSRSGELVTNNQDVNIDVIENYNLIQMPSEFTMIGEFSNLRSFLKGLYDGRDFFIVNEMTLSSNISEDGKILWQGGFNLTKYQFYPQANFDIVNSFGTISENEVPNQEVMEFLEKRYL